MIRSLIIALFCFVPMLSSAQGFDWQTTPRQPFFIPTRYAGIEVSSGYTLHSGKLNYLETATGINCCSYSNGTGIPFRVSILVEEWISASTSAQLGLGISRIGAEFISPSTPFPRENGDLVRTEYVFDASLTYLTLNAGASYRLLGSQLTIGGGLRLHFLLGTSQTQLERVVSPDDYTFTTNPRSRTHELESPFLEDIRGLQIEPFIQVGYNLAISHGLYLSPGLTFGFPVLSASLDQKWGMVDVGVRLRLMKGL